MFEKEYALLKLFEETDRIEGRKKLQKTVHLLQSKGIPYDVNFKYHYYGPYSADLQSQIDSMVAYNLIHEHSNGETYIYEITEKGREFMIRYRELVKNDFSLPKDSVKFLLSYPANVLELASTYAYLIGMGYDRLAAEAKAIELKPHLKHHMAEAERLYDSLLN